MRKETVQRIIDILMADATLKNAIKTWYYGPPTLPTLFPYCYVKWIGGPIETQTVTEDTEYDSYDVVFVDKQLDSDIAEKAVLNYMEKAMAVLRADPSLKGVGSALADDSWFVNTAGMAGHEGKSYVSGALATLTTRRTL